MPAKCTAVSRVVAKQFLVSSVCRGADGIHPELLSSSALMGLMEEACVKAMQEGIKDDQCSVGSITHLRHLAPTPLHAAVVVTATFRMFDGEVYWFDVIATDADGPVASGSHARSVVERSVIEFRTERRRNT